MKTMEQKIKATAERLGIRPEQVPRNVAVIMDGNGRWAQQKGLPRFEGHRQGAETAENLSLRCVDLGLNSLILYSFSMENWKRPQAEIAMLMHIYKEYLVGIRPILMKNGVKLMHLGRMAGLPEAVTSELERTMEMTANNEGMVLALALNYGGRTELVDATRAIARQCQEGRLNPEDIDDACISKHLYTANLPDPDLLVRTADEMRVSNFLLWQISYSEFYVTETFWPDFGNAAMDKAILAYASRNRRFGAIDTAALGHK